MKIMTYNIWEGGQDEQQPRLSFLSQVIKNANPDFLGIQEAADFDKNNLLKEFAKGLGFDYSDICVGTIKEKTAVASFSKMPAITKIKENKHLPYGFLVTFVETSIGPIGICNLHLSAGSEEERLNEIAAGLKEFLEFEHCILLGDFNALSAKDNYDDNIIEMFNGRLREKHVVDGKLQTRAIQQILDAGFEDAAVVKGVNNIDTGPTKASAYYPDNVTSLRVDYVFVSQGLKKYIKNVEVIKNDITEKASDHYPVVVELEFDN